MKLILATLLVVGGVVTGWFLHHPAQQLGGTTIAEFQGGTGTTTAPVSQLLYGGSGSVYRSVATTTGSCAGSVSCSSFTIVGVSPVALTGTGISSYDAFTHTTASNSATTSSIGIGTTTPFSLLSVVSAATSIFALATSTAGGSNTPIFEVDNTGHIITAGPKPSLSSCGSANSINGNDNSGTIMFTGTLVTACTLNRANAVKAGDVMSCVATDNSLVGFPSITATTTTSVTFGISSGLAAGTIYYHCDENVNN